MSYKYEPANGAGASPAISNTRTPLSAIPHVIYVNKKKKKKFKSYSSQ